jgi:hypothetical protein
MLTGARSFALLACCPLTRVLSAPEPRGGGARLQLVRPRALWELCCASSGDLRQAHDRISHRPCCAGVISFRCASCKQGTLRPERAPRQRRHCLQRSSRARRWSVQHLRAHKFLLRGRKLCASRILWAAPLESLPGVADSLGMVRRTAHGVLTRSLTTANGCRLVT